MPRGGTINEFATISRYRETSDFAQELLQSFRLKSCALIPGLPKLNPGLEFANTFGVRVLMRQVCYCRFNGFGLESNDWQDGKP